MKIQKIFYVSDNTALTAKSLGKSLLSQFENVYFMEHLRPFINTQKKVIELCQEIKEIQKQDEQEPVIFASVLNPQLMGMLRAKFVNIIDIIRPFIPSLEKLMGEKSSQRAGLAHKMINVREYDERIMAIDFTLSTDDGLKVSDYDEADIILLGVSRSGKTPTALYLALNFGLKVANYPFTSEDLPEFTLTLEQKKNHHKLFGLLISVERLTSIRKERRAAGNYSNVEQVSKELLALKDLFAREKIPFVDTTNRSVEEIASFIVSKKNIRAKITM